MDQDYGIKEAAKDLEEAGIEVTPESLPELEKPCTWCGGTLGERADNGEWFDCHECRGSGYVTTEFGEKVLNLMRHNFEPLLRRHGFR